MPKLMVTHLTHEGQSRKSFVSFVWTDDANKRLGLEVPYGTLLEEAQSEAEKAVRSLSGELASVEVTLS